MGEGVAPAKAEPAATVSAVARLRTIVLGTTAIVLVASGLWLWARSGFGPLPQTFMSSPVALLALTAATCTQTAGGLILGIRRPGNMVGWVILVFAVAIALVVAVNGYLALAESGWTGPFDADAVAMLPGVVSFPLGTFAAVALGMIFPDGHIAGARFRPFVAATAFGALFFALGVAATPGPLLWFPGYENPLPVPTGTPWPALLRYVVGPALLITGAVATSVALVDRYRTADLVGRLQLRWYVASAVLLTIGFVAYFVALYTLPPDSRLGELITIGFYAACGVPPVAMVVAINRYRLYDIDTIIGRAVVYGGLTAILAGLYTASIRLFNAVFVGLTGESSELALVISTLILATTFTPIKSRLERWVSARSTSTSAPDVDPVDDVVAPSNAATAATAALDDPKLAAAIDARIRTIVAEELARASDVAAAETPPTEGSEPPRTA